MKKKKIILSGLLLFKRSKYNDRRGFLSEICNENYFKEKKINLPFTILSSSKKNVIRGFHFQKKFPISQLVTCVKGSILDVVIDIRKKSKTFGKYQSFILSEKNNLSLFMSKGFAHGYLTLSNNSTVLYNNSERFKKRYD